jgi:hypothetical protein
LARNSALMRVFAHIILASALQLASSCSRTPQSYVLQSFVSPEIVGGTISLPLKGLDGDHAVGLVCSDAIWTKLLAKESGLSISASSAHGVIKKLGHRGSFCDQIPNCHFVCTITGKGDVSFRLSFPHSVSEELRGRPFQIVVMKTPKQTVL